MNIVMKISYLGINYYGFQRQRDKLTIQEVIEDTFLNVFKKKINIIGCSRTDRFVHAYEYYLNFHIEDFKVPPLNIKRGMNSCLPYDIRVLEVYEGEEGFHSRYSAKKKEYEYIILNKETHDPFTYDRCMHFKYDLNYRDMEISARYFLGTHDFKGFMSSGSSVKNTVRTIYLSKISRDNGYIKYNIVGDGFLYNMVRIIVGTIIMVGQGKIKLCDLENIIRDGDRRKTGFLSEGKGLYLKKVFYE